MFLSPPWGGPGYLESDTFTLSNMTPNGRAIYETAVKITQEIAYFVPRNSDVDEVPHALTQFCKCLSHSLPLVSTPGP